MSKREPNLLINDILDSAHKILVYTSNLTFDEFVTNSLVIDAVVRNFEIIGEAANRLPEEFKERYPSIDWHRLRGFRNRIVHDYMGIDFSIVWQIKEFFLPGIIAELERV